MGRLPKADRAAVADYTVSVRLAVAEREALEGLIEAQNQVLRADGLAITVTASSYLRTLLVQRAQQAGLLPTAPPVSKSMRLAFAEAGVSRSSGPKKKGEVLDRFNRPDAVGAEKPKRRTR